MSKAIRHPKDKYILFMFLGFFGLIFLINGIFAYVAVSSQTGLVTEDYYQKGLNYDQTLAEAKNQPKLIEQVTFDSSILRWKLADENSLSLLEASVTAKIIRPVQDGHDFDIVLMHKGNGLYEASLTLPYKGLWVAHMESQWTQNNQKKSYKTIYQFIQK